jgi:FtsP/CotA-like multicopper oxidase with cupredoxin domain
MTEGDHVFIKVINSNESEHTHSLYAFSSSTRNGWNIRTVWSKSEAIKPGESFTYEFIAGPAGLYPYHCHVEPIVDHINRGLYGAMIIDPKTPRTEAIEMVMLMNSYDLELNEELEPTARIPNAQEANQILYSPEPESEVEKAEAEAEAEAEETGPELEIERDNEFYTVNGRAFEYMDDPIKIKQENQLEYTCLT